MNNLDRIKKLAYNLKKMGLEEEADILDVMSEVSKFDLYEDDIGDKDFYPVGTFFNDSNIVIEVPRALYKKYLNENVEEYDLKQMVKDKELKAYIDTIGGEEWTANNEYFDEWLKAE